MKPTINVRLILSCLVLTLAACMGPRTPQEVNEAFWKAVINDHPAVVVKYSTLVDEKQYDAFSREWANYRPSWGKVTIDGERASVESTFNKSDGGGGDRRRFTSHLVQRNGSWFVDYQRTAEEVSGNIFSTLMHKLNEAGKDISVQLESAAGELDSDLARLGAELEKFTADLDREMAAKIEKFGEDLRDGIKELEESINRALEDRERNFSDQERRELLEVSRGLHGSSEELSRPSIQSIADGSREVARARIRLDSIDDGSAGEYKDRWRELGDNIETDSDRLFKALIEEHN